MVKTEVPRDYYADLELAPTADANEIKRQFKKLALKYHPDRNPGKELEFNSKFQAIQSANEVLTDPSQRAKYDAKRMQAGLLHTYMDKNPTPPPRPPPRSPTYKYPPPPRPPPPSATKPSFSPPPTGAQKYSRFSKADAPNVWTSSSAEDAKSKTNDFKAWEQMRHGQGPIPPKRTTPAKPPVFETGRTFAAGRAPNGTASKPSISRRPPWEHLQDAGMPRANTARVPPRKTGFTPGDSSSAVDEPPARSAYAYVSKSERPAAARSYTSMAPPPVHAPTAKNPDPLHNFKAHTGLNEAFGAGKRASAPYHTGGGEKTFTNPILQRSSTSASPRDGNSRSGWYDSDNLKVNGCHTRASSASSSHHANNQKPPGLNSSSSSSTSSSDEGQGMQTSAHRQKQIPKSRRSRMPAGARQRSFFTPNVTVEDAEDESMAPHQSLYTGPRRHSGIELPTYNNNIDRPEGFAEHRTKHEAEQSQRPSTSAPTTAAPHNPKSSPRIVQRHKSFDESYTSTPKAPKISPTVVEENNMTPIFRWHHGDDTKAFSGHPPLRSQSSDTININFSPSGTPPPKFGFDSRTFPPPPPCDHSSIWAGHSPDKAQTFTRHDPGGQDIHNGDTNTSEEKIPDIPVPPSPVREKYSSVDWDEKFSKGTFQWPQGRSSGRTSSRKRAGTPRTSSMNNVKRPGPLRTTETHAHFVGETDSPSVGTPNAFESASTSTATSRTSSNGSAMDLDPVYTPPSAGDKHSQAPRNSVPSGLSAAIPSTPRQGPTLPPRPPSHFHTTDESKDLGLGGLGNVAPFAPSNEGLEEVEDLKTSLPFQSRASPTRPIPDNVPLRSSLPKPPKAPSPPTTVTNATFDRYLADITHYLFLWNKFYKIMLQHFQARCEAQEDSKFKWVRNVGGDFDAYLKAMDEDEKVMKYWEVAQERHRDCMRALGVVREKAMAIER